MEQKTQQDIVLEKLIREGEVSNKWAIFNGIWRLGAVIHQIRQQGFNIVGEFEIINGRKTKMFKYRYLKVE
jgi:hypothetical protein